MAKVKYQFGIGCIRGKLANAIHVPARNELQGYIRKFTYPTLTQHNHDIGTIGANLASFWHNAAANWRADYSAYSQRYYAEHFPSSGWDPNRSPYAFFVACMFAWYDSDPTHVDLSVVTIADAVALDADVRTLSRAIGANFLLPIDDYSDLTHAIQ